jgi:predicted transcriptional regulator
MEGVNMKPGDAPMHGHRWAYAENFSRLVAMKGFRSFNALARASGVPQPSISKIMCGRVPRRATVDRLLSAMDATYDDLYDG